MLEPEKAAELLKVVSDELFDSREVAVDRCLKLARKLLREVADSDEKQVLAQELNRLTHELDIELTELRAANRKVVRQAEEEAKVPDSDVGKTLNELRRAVERATGISPVQLLGLDATDAQNLIAAEHYTKRMLAQHQRVRG